MSFIPAPIYPGLISLGGGGGGTPGPAGPAGSSGNTVSGLAGEALSGHRAVYFNASGQVFLASAAGVNASAAAGITVGSAAQGATVSVVLFGPVVEPSWAWVPGAVWLGASGLLTQVAPTVGTLVRIGTALSATSISVAPVVVAKL